MARITKAKQLTDRDRDILSDLARCRVLSLEQIKDQYWPKAKERTCLERLARLEKSGYLKSMDISAETPGQHMKVYCLDIKGRREVCGPAGLDKADVFITHGKQNEILHQVRTNQVYFRLSKTERETYKIGDLLEKVRGGRRAGGAEAPDAAYTSDEGEEIYIETDTGQYTGKQVKSKVASFAGKKVVWVCPQNRVNFLQKHGARGEFLTY
ncbi:replication-relaxation family protein [Desulforamulus hydrothermalis]|uniref:Replication-relaxation n=1 Tax=Desulforamulus hydrothermalis Lam5 = DSM 18033 TaxID=1121428 RepID=K8EB30_9FIRM|nr:replication-relaxation family protein [Desulforamulus hydrothermalis]CCO08848.1 conserved hypothetical protein [Desulforamulus hydrothermalis Lam5 = DSM 18033]SHG73121.1 Replication-relaxation [Desulforamulus hydrothermalis Lam5 = DSM 18033]